MTTTISLKNVSQLLLCPAVFVLLGSGIGLSQTTSHLLLPLSKAPKSASNANNNKNAKKPTGVDLCLVQKEHVKGVTSPKGIQLSEADPLSYVVLKPSFTLTEKHVKKM